MELRYSMEELVKRAMRNARPNSTINAPRWVAVKDTFGCGSTVAYELCEAFGMNPEEEVRGVYCEACEP